jgi:hypothetical protein
MARLANSERGLSPYAFRQLYLACITSVADYGSIIWWKGQAQFQTILQSLQNLGLWKVLGAFKTTPIIPIEVEAALPPPAIRLNDSVRQYAFRLLKLALDHLVNKKTKELETSKTSKPTQLARINQSI